MKNKVTSQMVAWNDKFGKNYTDRNTFTVAELDKVYSNQYGISRTEMNKEFLFQIKDEIKNILEVGCNIGSQLALLQSMGFDNLFGIEYQRYAVEKAKEMTKGINIIQGSAFEIPFKDKLFDVVFTSGVLIHISPKDINVALDEIYRCSRKYIWGFEYFSENYTEIRYRGNSSMLWKTNFCKLYLEKFKDLELVKEKKYKYTETDNIDSMFLLKKRS